MNRIQKTLVVSFAVVALQACASTSSNENSSGSNWLTCKTLDDCHDTRAVACSPQGYCLDVHGERIAASTTDASRPPPSPTSDASKPTTDAAHTPKPTTDAAHTPPPATDGAQPPVLDASRPPPPTDASHVPASHDAGATLDAGACDTSYSSTGPLVPRPGETCYDFALHGASSPTDTSPFSVQPGESFNQVYYAVPWPSGTVATAYGIVQSPGSPALRAWLFGTSSNTPPGTVSKNVTGTLLGENAKLLAAWGNGGCNVVLPEPIGVELPSTGTLVVQWHHENVTASAQNDTSVLRVCTVPASARAKRSALTWLGTENFNGLSGAPVGTSQTSGVCTSNANGPVTVFSIQPYMHRIGARMTTTIERAGGQVVTLLDAPFQFDHQRSYLLPVSPPPVLMPGDKIRTTCTYDNSTGANVPFGQSSHQEMCFAFATVSPPGALDNGVISLVGATNTCW